VRPGRRECDVYRGWCQCQHVHRLSRGVEEREQAHAWAANHSHVRKHRSEETLQRAHDADSIRLCAHTRGCWGDEREADSTWMHVVEWERWESTRVLSGRVCVCARARERTWSLAMISTLSFCRTATHEYVVLWAGEGDSVVVGERGKLLT
jgi:hypothetical protein